MTLHGWELRACPVFLQQLQRLKDRVAVAQRQHPETYLSSESAKLLVLIESYMYQKIPANPNSSEFRQGNTLGKDHRDWFRAKFNQRFRLFFRFFTSEKIIFYGWVNDATTLRKAGAKTDPYTIFKGMLDSGNPPSDLPRLLALSKRVQ